MGSDDRRIQLRGSTVVRPAGYWSPAVHAFLEHLHQQGFDGAPRPISRTADREILTLIPGETPGKHFVAPWSGDDQLASVARLVRRCHDAAASYVPPAGTVWQETSIPTVGTLVCHTDLYRGNVVFRGGRAVGLIDFDFAHPADPLWDLAVAVWHWVPLSEGWRSAVPVTRWPERLNLFADTYGLPADQRHKIIDCLAAFLRNVRRRAVAAGRDARQVNRDIETLDRHRSRLLEALRPGIG